jgi:hypothetical protein
MKGGMKVMKTYTAPEFFCHEPLESVSTTYYYYYYYYY